VAGFEFSARPLTLYHTCGLAAGFKMDLPGEVYQLKIFRKCPEKTFIHPVIINNGTTF
jgi:hypothetical protein